MTTHHHFVFSWLTHNHAFGFVLSPSTIFLVFSYYSKKIYWYFYITFVRDYNTVQESLSRSLHFKIRICKTTPYGDLYKKMHIYWLIVHHDLHVCLKKLGKYPILPLRRYSLYEGTIIISIPSVKTSGTMNLLVISSFISFPKALNSWH